VFVVATSRYGPPLAAIGDRDSWQTIDVDDVENRADMRRFLVEAVSGDHPLPDLVEALSRQGVDAAGFVDTLTDRCAGVWIYLRYVLDDIMTDRCSPRDVAGLPERLAGYYLEQIQRWRTVGEWGAVGLPVLATLVALRRPASQHDVARLAGLSEGDRLSGWLDRQFRSFLDLSRTPRRERPVMPSGTKASGTCLTHRITTTTATMAPATPCITQSPPHTSGSARTSWRQCTPSSPAARSMTTPEPNSPTTSAPRECSMTPRPIPRSCSPVTPRRCCDCAKQQQRARRSAPWPPNELSRGHHDTDADLWWLHVWARKTRCHRLADRVTEWLGRLWTVTAGMWSGTSHRSLIGHTSGVSGVCAVPLADGRTLLASASWDRAVLVWKPAADFFRTGYTTQT
jgi:hypothetical protein